MTYLEVPHQTSEFVAQSDRASHADWQIPIPDQATRALTCLCAGRRGQRGAMLYGSGRKNPVRVTQRKHWGWRLGRGLTVAVSALLLLASCTSASGHGSAAAAPSARVISLTTISTLKSLFNRSAGHPRLLLLLSPT